MKQYLLALLLLCAAFAANAQFSLGLAVYRGFDIEETGLQVRGMYGFTPEWRGSVNYVNYFDDRENFNAWELNLDAHYIVQPGGNADLYLLAGLGILGTTVDRGLDEDTETEAGINIGAGGQIYLTRGLSAQLELKYFLSDLDQLGLGFGLTYTF